MKLREAKPLDPNSPCGCGSDLKYAKCCLKIGRQYELDKKGRIFRVVKLDDRTIDVLKDTEQAFRAVFGRKPDRKDLVFFDTLLHSERDRNRQFREAAQLSGLDPAIVFAIQRTGLIIAKDNQRLFNRAEKLEWSKAIEEYRDLAASEADPFAAIDFPTPEAYFTYEELIGYLKSILIIIANFIRRNGHKASTERPFLFLYLLLRAQHSLRTCFHLAETRATEDMLAILRNAYEAFVRIRAMRCNPEIIDSF